MRPTLRIALLASVLALSACASTHAASARNESRDCFRTVDVHGYSVIDDHSVKLRVGASREYIVTVLRNTGGLNWVNGLSVHSFSSFVCVGDPTGIELEGGNPPSRYRVTAIERAPAEEAAAQGS